MIDTGQIDSITKRLLNILPTSMQDVQKDIEKNIHAVLQATFAKMELVTREEFDVQSRVLARTREKLEVLEKQVQELEKTIKWLIGKWKVLTEIINVSRFSYFSVFLWSVIE